MLDLVESNKKMATQDRSPSYFAGQAWTAWAENQTVTDANDDDEDVQSTAEDESDSMKLNKKDMDLFGRCPFSEEFTLAKCELCGMWVKPQALKLHIEVRHGPSETVLEQLKNLATASKSHNLKSELARTLSSPVTSLGKASKPPTKAILKQVPKCVRTGGSGGSSRTGNKAESSSSRLLQKAMANPVVWVERIPKEVVKKVTTATVMSSSPSLKDVMSSSPTAVTTTAHAASSKMDSSRSKSVVNGAVAKKGMVASHHLSCTAHTSTTVTTQAARPQSLTTVTTSVTTTRPTPVTLPSSSDSSKCAFYSKISSSTREMFSSALAATLTASSTPFRTTLHSSSSSSSSSIHGSSSSKGKKLPKERKFLPCKDREFDADRHCGVLTEETGKPCTRSLTCKTHSLGLRRKVAGRTKSFDQLLREHKAAKEAHLKARAEGHTVSSGSITPTASSPQTSAPSLDIRAAQQEASVLQDSKTSTLTLVSQSGLPRLGRPHSSTLFQKLTPAGSTSNFIIKEESSSFDPTRRLSSESHSSQSSERRSSQSSDHASSQSSERRSSHSSERHWSSREGRSSQSSEHRSLLSGERRLSSSGDRDRERTQEKQRLPSLSHHPRPAAVCTFGARKISSGCWAFSRQTDRVRAAFQSALDRQLNPPPHKKLCVESSLPRDSQSSSTSKDPYEFNTAESGLAQQRQTISFTIGNPSSSGTGLMGKPLLKHRAKSLSSHSLNVSALATSSGSPGTPTTIAIPGLAAALLKPTKASDLSGGMGLKKATLSMASSLSSQSLKRKRSSGSQGGGSGHSASPATVQLQGGGVGLTVTTGADGNRTSQQQSTTLLVPSTAANSHSTTPITAITIPNLANATGFNLSATTTLSNSKSQGQKPSLIKDGVNLLLTGIDPSQVNGQLVNITGAQLAELAAAQAVSATAEDKNIKRSRLANTKHSTGQKVSGTLETLRAFQGNNVLTAVPPNAILVDRSAMSQSAVLVDRTLQGVPSNAVLVDRNLQGATSQSTVLVDRNTQGTLSQKAVFLDRSVQGAGSQKGVVVDKSLQGAVAPNTVLVDRSAVLAPVSSLNGAASGGSSTLVALSSTSTSSAQSSSSITVAPNTIFRTVNEPHTPQQVALTTASFTNGIIPSSGDKVLTTSGSSHNHLHHHQQRSSTNSTQGRMGTPVSAKTLASSPSLLNTSGSSSNLTQLAHLKPGTFNISKTGKITVQPSMSVTIPIVSSMGLGALATTPSSQQQQQQSVLSHPALLVTSAAADEGRGGASGGGSKAELHFQPQMSSASSGVIS